MLAAFEVDCDCSFDIAAMTSFGPSANPALQPVIAYVFDKRTKHHNVLLALRHRRPAHRRPSRSSDTRSTRPASRTPRASAPAALIAWTSAADITAPEGFEGVQRIIALVFSVIAASIIDAVTRKSSRSSLSTKLHHATRVLDDVLVRHPVRYRQNHLFAVIHQHLQRIEQRQLSARR